MRLRALLNCQMLANRSELLTVFGAILNRAALLRSRSVHDLNGYSEARVL